jgi:hypothetical protein
MRAISVSNAQPHVHHTYEKFSASHGRSVGPKESCSTNARG